MAFTEGPYVQAACLCELVIEDKTGPMSLIRIIDTITHTAAGPNPPEDLQPFNFAFQLALMLKSGKAVGRHEVKIVPDLPSGETEKPVNATVHLEGEEKGQNLIINMAITFKYEGLYWFNVYFDGEKLTAIPLRVKYNRIIVGA